MIYAVSAAKYGSFTAAAAEHNITESGLHKQIRRLEAELDIHLFERSGRTIRVTNEGRELIERMEAVVEAARDVASLADSLHQGYAGVVTIGCYPVHVIRFLAPAIGGFERAHPGLWVRLGQHPGDQMVEGKRDLYQELFKGRIDFTIGPLRPRGVANLPAYTARVIAVVGESHPYRRRPVIEIDVLRDARFITLPRGLWVRNRFEEACAGAGFTPRIEVETTVESLVALAREEYAIGILSDDNLWGRTEHPYPAIVDASGNELAAMNWLQWREAEPLSAAAEAFLRYVEEHSPA